MSEKRAVEIIIENLQLPAQNLPILEMLDKQESLIIEFISLGYSKEDFYLFSRNKVGIDEGSNVINSADIEIALKKYQ